MQEGGELKEKLSILDKCIIPSTNVRSTRKYVGVLNAPLGGGKKLYMVRGAAINKDWSFFIREGGL